MHRKEATILTNMCMIRDREGRVVMQHHSGDWPGWVFPGGHVEYGESLTKAVIREVYEETGLTIRSPRLCGVKDWHHPVADDRYLVLMYIADQFSGEIVSSDEGDVRWVSMDEFPTLPMPNGMKEMLRVFLEDDVSEMFYTIDENDVWTPHFY